MNGGCFADCTASRTAGCFRFGSFCVLQPHARIAWSKSAVWTYNRPLVDRIWVPEAFKDHILSTPGWLRGQLQDGHGILDRDHMMGKAKAPRKDMRSEKAVCQISFLRCLLYLGCWRPTDSACVAGRIVI